VKQHKLALGKYITILDSDDALDKKCLTHFFNVTANIGADIVLGNFAY
jgi:hypothetical protein